MDMAIIQAHTQSSAFNNTPTEDIISYGLLLIGETSETVSRILKTFQPPPPTNSIDIDDLIAEYQKESDSANPSLVKRFGSLEEMCVGARGWKEEVISKKKKTDAQKETSTEEKNLLPGEAGRGVSLRELTLFLQEIGAKNPTTAAAFIKKIIESIRRSFSVAARIEEIEISTCKPKDMAAFLKTYEKSERFLNYINLVLGNTKELPLDNDSKRTVTRFYGLADKGWQSKLKEVIKDQAKTQHKALVIFGKETCKEKDPLCNACPIGHSCFFKAANSAVV